MYTMYRSENLSYTYDIRIEKQLYIMYHTYTTERGKNLKTLHTTILGGNPPTGKQPGPVQLLVGIPLTFNPLD